MLHERDMVRKDGTGPIMKIVGIDQDEAECVWFDGRGVIHRRRYEIDNLSPFWLSTHAKTLWPDINNIPDEGPAEQTAKSKRPKRSRRVKR